MINILKTRSNEIYDSYLDEFGYLDKESLLMKIQGKLEEEDVVVVVMTEVVPHAGVK